MGDGTNLVLILAGELLKVAENLLIMGLHPSEVTQGYEMALKRALEELDSECPTLFCVPCMLLLRLRRKEHGGDFSSFPFNKSPPHGSHAFAHESYFSVV